MNFFAKFFKRFFKIFSTFFYYKHLFNFLKNVNIKEKAVILKWIDNEFFTSDWNFIFKINKTSKKKGYIFYNPDYPLPSYEHVKTLILKEKPGFFILTGIYFSPSDKNLKKWYKGIYLSQLFDIAHKYNYLLYLNFLSDDTVEIFLFSNEYKEIFLKYFGRYNPLYKFAYYNENTGVFVIPEKGFYLNKKGLLSFKEYASFYILSLSSIPISLSFETYLTSNAPISVRVHFNMIRMKNIELNATSTSMEIKDVLINPFQGSGIQLLNLHPPENRQEISLKNIKVYFSKSDYNFFCKSLPFDKYQRHQIIKGIVEYFKSKKLIKPTGPILDIGGNPGYLKNFLPEFTITVIDEEPCDYIYQMPRSVFLKYRKYKKYFEVVCAIDVLEHIDINKRNKFLFEAFGYTRKFLILSFPVNKPEIKEAEKLLFEFEKEFFERENRFLKEHLSQPLPTVESVLDFCKKQNIPYKILPNAFLPRWFSMMLLNLIKEYTKEEFSAILEFNRKYNDLFYAFDNKNPSYRVVIILGRNVAQLELITYDLEKELEENKELQILNYPTKILDILDRPDLTNVKRWLEERKEILEKIENISF